MAGARNELLLMVEEGTCRYLVGKRLLNRELDKLGGRSTPERSGYQLLRNPSERAGQRSENANTVDGDCGIYRVSTSEMSG